MKTLLRFGRGLTAAFALILPLTFAARTFGAESVHYAYDEAGRLIGLHYSGGKSITYLYDQAGNLVRKTITTFTDADGDGMDDAWEMLHFGSHDRDGAADFDQDGMSDLAEFLAGTDPKDSGSLLRITELSSTGGIRFRIEWPAVPGRIYRVQYNETLNPADWKNLAGDVTATGPTAAKTDDTVIEPAKRFYRLQVLH
jgi:YD repeat-containing protein